MTGYEALEALRFGRREAAYLLVGEVDYWVRRWLRSLRQTDRGAAAVSELEGRVSWGEVQAELSRTEFFAGQRVVLVRQAGLTGKERGLLRYLERPLDDVTLVVMESKPPHPLLDAFGPARTVEGKGPTLAEMRRFVHQEANSRGLRLSAEGEDWLAKTYLGEGEQVVHELEKLALYSLEQSDCVFDEAQLRELILPWQSAPQTWRLVDAVLDGDVEGVLHHARAALGRGEPPVMLAVMVGRQLASLQRACELRAAGGTLEAFQSQSRLSGYAARRAWNRAGQLGAEVLHQALSWAKAADAALKGGGGDPEVVLTTFLAAVALTVGRAGAGAKKKSPA
ncbi:MAG: DNA polymerase III subunit delta [Firmicutes bacterium]|nr:DNA polymerase III subunit delta [Bacillota bacterium]